MYMTSNAIKVTAAIGTTKGFCGKSDQCMYVGLPQDIIDLTSSCSWTSLACHAKPVVLFHWWVPGLQTCCMPSHMSMQGLALQHTELTL